MISNTVKRRLDSEAKAFSIPATPIAGAEIEATRLTDMTCPDGFNWGYGGFQQQVFECNGICVATLEIVSAWPADGTPDRYIVKVNYHRQNMTPRQPVDAPVDLSDIGEAHARLYRWANANRMRLQRETMAIRYPGVPYDRAVKRADRER